MIECKSPWIHMSHRSIHRCHDISWFHLDSKWETNRKHIEVFKWLRPRRRCEYSFCVHLCVAGVKWHVEYIWQKDMKDLDQLRVCLGVFVNTFGGQNQVTHWRSDSVFCHVLSCCLDMSRPHAKVIKHVQTVRRYQHGCNAALQCCQLAGERARTSLTATWLLWMERPNGSMTQSHRRKSRGQIMNFCYH